METSIKMFDADNTIYVRKKREHRKNKFTFIAQSLMPPEDLEITDWAEQNIELPARLTRHPGLIRIKDLIPYAVEPLNSFKHAKRTVLIWGAQTAKTTVMECAHGYIVDQDPGPTMIVFPDQSTGKKRSKEHLQVIIDNSASLSRHKTSNQDDYSIFLYHFDRMTTHIVWAGSPSALSSEPIRFLIRDEFAKYPDSTKKEADAMSLSERRTVSYSWMARILDCTTPTMTNATGWQDLLNGTHRRCWVPCPHCGEYQVLVFAQITFVARIQDEKFSIYLKRVKKSVAYKCVHCEESFSDKEKRKIIFSGDWRAENPEAEYESYHLPSWYAPWVTFYDVVRRFLEATYGFENKTLQDWVNSDCAEPWEERGENAELNEVLLHKIDYAPGTVPCSGPVLCIITIDVQKDYLFYKVIAYTLTASYLVEYGTLSVLADEEDLRKKVFTGAGFTFSPEFSFIDTGYRTSEVYEYVLSHPGCIAIKGQDGEQAAPIRWQNITKYPGQEKNLPGTLKLCHIKTTYFKERVLLDIAQGIDDDGIFNADDANWFLHNETSAGYARHITAETVITKKDSRGYEKRIWKKIRKRNDYLDCEVYSRAGRYILDDYLKSKVQPPQEEVTHGDEQQAPDGWR